MRRFSFLLALAFTLCCSALGFAQQPQKKTLPNGLTVLVKENHAAPVVAVRFYVKTGSIYEGEYIGSGISHLFEHVLQEGSKTRSKEQINAETQAIGGQTNAYTGNDVTAYHIVTASRYFDRALNNLADSMMNATFPDAEVKTQQGVIHHEMNMGEDNPNRILYETFYKTAFLEHPVRYPVIGYREIFDRITREDIVKYYNTHYTPNNTILAVAGDVEAEEVFTAAEKVLGSWERRAALTPTLPSEPMQNTPRRAVVEKQVQNALAMMGWHTIPLQHPDLYALDALAKVLGGGESSRLVQELREDRELVHSIDAWSHTPHYDAGVFAIMASLPKEKLANFEKAVWEQINLIKTRGVSTAELKRAQRQIETDFLFNNDVAQQAEQMAFDYMGTGNPGYSAQYVSRINAVTPAQVQAAARKYLLPQGTTVTIVKSPEKTPAASQAANTPNSNALVGEPKLFTLKNGLRVIIRENHTVPTVSIAAMGLAGARYEPLNKAGLAYLTSSMLYRGTTKRSGSEFTEIIDELGGNFESSSGYNSWTVNSTWLARDWRRGLSLVHEAITMPAFSEEGLARAKSLMMAALKEQEEDPDSVASLLVRNKFYGNHPYGRSTLGTEQSIQALTRADVVNFWNRVRNPQQTVLAIYGDINSARALEVVEYLFSSMRGNTTTASDVAEIRPLTQRVTAEKSMPDIAQTVLYFAYPGITVRDEDRYALSVLDGALSGIYYPGGRLHARLRDNQLVYGVHAFPMTGLDGGAILIVAATTKEKRDEVKSIIEEEVNRIATTPISPEELERAKGMAITAHAVELQTHINQAGSAISNELFGLGFKNDAEFEKRINTVTQQEVLRVAAKYLRPDASAFAVVQPE